jgi:glycosyltransferase involved in cell wall biosynthesis
MSETIEKAVESVAKQIPKENFEILILDGGSDDGSIDKINSLADNYSHVRSKLLEPDQNRYLGKDRQLSFQAAKGENVIFQVDTDDVYKDIITDFILIYEKLQDSENTAEDFILCAHNIVIAPREYMLENGFRNMKGAEDSDLYQRALSRDEIYFINLEEPICEQVGYEKGKKRLMSRFIDEQVCYLQSSHGIIDYLYWIISRCKRTTDYTIKRRIFEIIILPYSFLISLRASSYQTPEPYEKRWVLQEYKEENSLNIREIEDKFNVNISEELSTKAREVISR